MNHSRWGQETPLLKYNTGKLSIGQRLKGLPKFTRKQQKRLGHSGSDSL